MSHQISDEDAIKRYTQCVKRMSRFEKVFTKNILEKARRDCNCMETMGEYCVFCLTAITVKGL